MISIVGMGPGEAGYLTEKGKAVIETADCLIGGKRHLAAYEALNKKLMVLSNNLEEILSYIEKNKSKEHICLLASGDPLTYGIGKMVIEQFKGEVTIVSGISSMSYMFSRIPLDMNEVYITSSHGKTPDFDKLALYPKVAMVTDKAIGPYEIAQEMYHRGSKKLMWIGENLSYANEQLTRRSLDQVENRVYDMNVVVMVDEE